MINKINRLYSIFKSDIVFSDNTHINAIEGYDVVEQETVLTVKDICAIFSSENINMDKIHYRNLYKYSNPISGEEWYIGDHFIAYKSKDPYGYSPNRPMIIAIRYRYKLIVNDLQTAIDYSGITGLVTDIKVVSSIGYLSTPHNVYTNIPPDLFGIKLPFVV